MSQLRIEYSVHSNYDVARMHSTLCKRLHPNALRALRAIHL